MSNKKFLKVLEQMKGKTFHYAKQIHFIQDYKIDEDDEKCIITTNLSSFSRKYESMDEFLKYWEEVHDMKETTLVHSENHNGVDLYIEKENALADEMIDILRDNIKKVQENPAYVKQAQVINNNVNSIINVVRTKMDFLKQIKRK